MPVRERLTSMLHTTLSGVASVLAEDPEVDLSATEARIDALERSQGERATQLETRVAELQAAEEKLEKRLSMAMGAIQAATAQLVQLREALAQMQNQAQQAMQRSTTALSTAETAADGVAAVEEALAALRDG